MNGNKRCPSCGREFDASYRHCPFDASPLVEPKPEPPPPPVEPPPPSPPAASGTHTFKATEFTFIERAEPPGWKTVAKRPVTILFTLGALITAFCVWYLNWRTGGPDLPPPVVSYSLLPNEGKTKGVPIAIKVNGLAVMLIDDPVESGGGAARAKEVVAALHAALEPLRSDHAVRFAVDTVEGRPVILEISEATGQRRTLVTATEADVILAGETEGLRLASRWAERLTDAVKVFVFGEAPTFSTGTEFGEAFVAMYKAARGSGQGRLTKRDLDRAYRGLTAEQRQALETPPIITP